MRGVPAAAAERLQVREDIKPDEARGAVGTETLKVGDGETTGVQEAKLGGAPADAAAFSELEGDSAMEVKAETWPTGTL